MLSKRTSRVPRHGTDPQVTWSQRVSADDSDSAEATAREWCNCHYRTRKTGQKRRIRNKSKTRIISGWQRDLVEFSVACRSVRYSFSKPLPSATRPRLHEVVGTRNRPKVIAAARRCPRAQADGLPRLSRFPALYRGTSGRTCSHPLPAVTRLMM